MTYMQVVSMRCRVAYTAPCGCGLRCTRHVVVDPALHDARHVKIHCWSRCELIADMHGTSVYLDAFSSLFATATAE